MVSTLYILLPSKADAHLPGAAQTRPFALVSVDGGIAQHGEQTLDGLATLIQEARSVVLLLAASDVSLLQIKVPPLSSGKLKAALPNLVEDHIIGDPNDCVLLAHAAQDGMCQIAVADKKWLTALFQDFKHRGAKKIAAYPLQLCLEIEPGRASALISIENNSVELAVRSSLHDGAGMSLQGLHDVDLVGQVLQALSIVGAETDFNVLVPTAQLRLFQEQSELTPDYAKRMNLKPANWESRIKGINAATFDLMSGIRSDNYGSFDWAVWRWPIYLVVAVLLANIIALNVQWYSMRREANGLMAALNQTFRTAYPKEAISDDPMRQMRQKIMLAEKLSGQASADDFVVMAAQFAQVWDRLLQGAGGDSTQSIAAVEYHERTLFVKIKSSLPVPIEKVRAALNDQGMTLVSNSDGVLKIKNSDKGGK